MTTQDRSVLRASDPFQKASCAARSNSRKKSPVPFSLRLTDEERAALEQQAGAQPLGTYIRDCLLDGKAQKRRASRKPRVDEQQLAQVLAALGHSHLSSNLNQLAKHANDCGGATLFLCRTGTPIVLRKPFKISMQSPERMRLAGKLRCWFSLLCIWSMMILPFFLICCSKSMVSKQPPWPAGLSPQGNGLPVDRPAKAARKAKRLRTTSRKKAAAEPDTMKMKMSAL